MKRPDSRKRLHANGEARIRLSEVAASAGVSTASVSRAMNNPGSVSPAVRERVAAAIADLGYVPHGAARALASQRSRSIGVLIPTLENSIFAAGVHGLERRLAADGYTVLLASSDYDPAKEVAQARVLIERGVDGLVLVGTAHHPDLYARLEATGLPYVTTWSFETAGEPPCVGIDNRAAMAAVARYLVDLGHMRFGVVSVAIDSNDRIAARRGGIFDGLAERGLSAGDATVIESPYSISGGREALRTLMALAHPPSAVICTSDVLAFGVLAEAHALGIPVPDRLSITGFDDLDFAQHLSPPLTTVRVPAAELGHRAADYLLARLAGRPVAPRIELPTSLTVRATTAPPGRQ